ncbi:MAG: hypothetical protein GC152_03345 [Alphaproteobacteria bacterium]|nr:hypothetical protein [Alphaproteobacteria bacterium]
MLLRRMIAHVRDQNWTAIFLDFVIVVAGVFLGIQLGAWNDARIEGRRQADYLRELRQEVAVNNGIIEARATYSAQVVAAAAETLAWLDGDGDCADACEAVVIDAFHASQAWGSDISDVVAAEMRRQGLPRSPGLKRMTQTYYFYSEGLDRSLENAAAYRERVRRRTPLSVMQALWRACFFIDKARIETIIEDCDPGLDAGEAARVARAYFDEPGLGDDLRYWAGQNDLWIDVFRTQVTIGETLIAMIDEELGERRH